jgi:DNA-binding GntR family transcriptional regulator
MPSTNTLAQTYDLSTSTVRKAMRQLSAEGLTVATQGYATFVKRAG